MPASLLFCYSLLFSVQWIIIQYAVHSCKPRLENVRRCVTWNWFARHVMISGFACFALQSHAFDANISKMFMQQYREKGFCNSRLWFPSRVDIKIDIFAQNISLIRTIWKHPPPTSFLCRKVFMIVKLWFLWRWKMFFYNSTKRIIIFLLISATAHKKSEAQGWRWLWNWWNNIFNALQALRFRCEKVLSRSKLQSLTLNKQLPELLSLSASQPIQLYALWYLSCFISSSLALCSILCNTIFFLVMIVKKERGFCDWI